MFACNIPGYSRLFPATCASCPRREARVTLSERKPPWRLCCQTPTCASCPRREAQVEPNPAKCVETMKMKILWQHIARTLQYTRLLQNLVPQASQKRVLRFLSACFCGQTRSFQTYALNILESLYKFQPAKGWKAMVKHLYITLASSERFWLKAGVLEFAFNFRRVCAVFFLGSSPGFSA